MDIVFNTDYYHRRIIDGTVLYGDEGDPSWTQLYIQGVLASFKSNLKQSTAVWLIYLVMMGILLVDIRVMGAFGTAVSQTLQFVFVVGICMVSAVMVYALAYIARFTQDVRHILTNSVLMAIRHFARNTAAGCCSGGGSAGLLPVWAWDCLYPCCGSPGG